jgi:hypothetical protein
MVIDLPPETVPISAPPDDLLTLSFASHRMPWAFHSSAAMYLTR